MSDNKSKTHGVNCWAWGPDHYDCAVFEITRLREENARQAAEIERLRETLSGAQRRLVISVDTSINSRGYSLREEDMLHEAVRYIRAALTQEPAEPRALASDKGEASADDDTYVCGFCNRRFPADDETGAIEDEHCCPACAEKIRKHVANCEHHDVQPYLGDRFICSDCTGVFDECPAPLASEKEGA